MKILRIFRKFWGWRSLEKIEDEDHQKILRILRKFFEDLLRMRIVWGWGSSENSEAFLGSFEVSSENFEGSRFLRIFWGVSRFFDKYFRQVEWKHRKTHWYEAVSSGFHFPFLKEVLQNCFVFDVLNFENWGSLAEFLRFRRCQAQKLRKSHRIAAFLMLSSSEIKEVSWSSKIKDVSQNSFVFNFQACR